MICTSCIRCSPVAFAADPGVVSTAALFTTAASLGLILGVVVGEVESGLGGVCEVVAWTEAAGSSFFLFS